MNTNMNKFYVRPAAWSDDCDIIECDTLEEAKKRLNNIKYELFDRDGWSETKWEEDGGDVFQIDETGEMHELYNACDYRVYRGAISGIIADNVVCDLVNERVGELVDNAIDARLAEGADDSDADSDNIYIELTKHLNIDLSEELEASDKDELYDVAEDRIMFANLTDEGEQILIEWVRANYPIY